MISSTDYRDPTQLPEEVMQPSTSSLVPSVPASSQHAAAVSHAASSFRTVAFALLVDRALAA
jgi:hypothetical protein